MGPSWSPGQCAPWSGSSGVSQNDMSMFQALDSANVSLFGKRVSADIIEDFEMRSVAE